MGRQLNYNEAYTHLKAAFEAAEAAFSAKDNFDVSAPMITATDQLFLSKTQAFREALVDCALAKLLDPEIDIRLIYMNQGDNAFNARTLNQEVVNPFFRDKAIPCSTNPYLSTLRRSVRLNEDTAKGVQDKAAYAALLKIISELEVADTAYLSNYLHYFLDSFIILRESSQIALSKVNRFRVDQHASLVQSLLQTPSGGLLPVLLSVAMFQTIQNCFSLPWNIEWQGINVADRASNAAGDITVKRNGHVVLVVEVTERPIGRERVVSTFNTKIAPNGLDDYLFFFTATPPDDEARAAANQYFAQGHDINFVPVKDWILTTLTTIGPDAATCLLKQ